MCFFHSNDLKYVINLKDEKKIQMKNDKKHEMNFLKIKSFQMFFY